MLLDFFGAFFSLASTVLFIRMDRKAWLFVIVATALNSFLYFFKGIYADTLLELFYLLSSLYGYFLWTAPEKEQKIKRSVPLTLLVFSFLILYLLILYSLTVYTNSQVKHLDAITTSLSLIGQVLMAYKFIVTWLIWFITDALYCWLYYHKNLHFHAALMLFYTALAIVGYFSWNKKIQSAKEDKRNFVCDKPVT